MVFALHGAILPENWKLWCFFAYYSTKRAGCKVCGGIFSNKATLLGAPTGLYGTQIRHHVCCRAGRDTARNQLLEHASSLCNTFSQRHKRTLLPQRALDPIFRSSL
jgi:hypothetical protein